MKFLISLRLFQSLTLWGFWARRCLTGFHLRKTVGDVIMHAPASHMVQQFNALCRAYVSARSIMSKKSTYHTYHREWPKDDSLHSMSGVRMDCCCHEYIYVEPITLCVTDELILGLLGIIAEGIRFRGSGRSWECTVIACFKRDAHMSFLIHTDEISTQRAYVQLS